MSLAVLTGAKKNFGDFLIESRLVALLKDKFPGAPLHVIPRWESHEERHIETMKTCDAVFCGGGAIRPQRRGRNISSSEIKSAP